MKAHPHQTVSLSEGAGASVDSCEKFSQNPQTEMHSLRYESAGLKFATIEVSMVLLTTEADSIVCFLSVAGINIS